MYSHQERFDGTGYPRGLKGEEIPLGISHFLSCRYPRCHHFRSTLSGKAIDAALARGNSEMVLRHPI